MPSTSDSKTQKKKSSASAEENNLLDNEIRSNILKIVAIEEEQKAHRTLAEKIAEVIANFCGSMTFVYVHIVWFGLWIGINSTKSVQFDPFPYTFLTLVVSLEAIFLSTFILISQNHETKLTERRNQLDLQVNLLAERENTKMLELLNEIAQKVGVPAHDPETKALLEPMKPERLVEQIMTATGDNSPEKGSR